MHRDRAWGRIPAIARRTVRVRLTALYSALFLATSTTLLVVVNLLLRDMLERRVTLIRNSNQLPPEVLSPPGTVPQNPPTPVPIRHTPEIIEVTDNLRDDILQFQWTVTAIVVVVLTAVSVAAGWWLAGRLLRPLHRITTTARRLSLSNLHERIALAGPDDELKELADTFDAMLDRLERSVRSQRQFIANASHELRTPLAIQRAAIEIGLDDPPPERLAEVRRELLTVNRRTERLIDGLLTLAQGDRGLDAPEPVALDVLIQQARNDVPADGVTVHLTTEPTVVSGDPVLLNRLFANLLHNAIRYNRPGGVVEVSLAGYTLTVRNTGPEVPEERVNELFEPFRRLHTDRTGSVDGAGLGLSIVASIARAHSATVTARPNPGGGLEVSVRFPRPDTAAALPRQADAVAAGSTG
ncbi:HAMP domain-containing sensor histidine kinase [Micromonospora sp. HM5-17]|uniref:sensor histidine kinase n=1 Tax=Micromonospora sp. HM5-17 TaxID=2487710 RepID=UPI0018F46392|nr:HAMP domain-containing sensor histidine kinase [Micromonospora sp. HM5-17]